MHAPHRALGSQRNRRHGLQENSYNETHQFLGDLARDGERIATVALQCLDLSKSLGLVIATEPWLLASTSLRYPSVAILPMEAAITAHFCLAALKEFASERKIIFFHGISFELEFDSEKLREVLEETFDFLETLKNDRLNAENPDDLDTEAEYFLGKLEEILKFNLPINSKAIQILFSEPRI